MKLFVDAEVLTRPRISGIGHATLELLRALDKRAAASSLQITAIVPFGTARLLDRYRFMHVRVRSGLPCRRIWNYLLTRTSLSIPIDWWFGKGVYLFPDYRNWFVPRSRSLTIVYDVAFKLYPDTVQAKNRHYLAANMPRWIKRTNIVLCISHAAAAEFIQCFPDAKQKVAVLPLGVDPQVYTSRVSSETEAVCKKYGLPIRYFLSVGNIEPRKNLGVLLDAYQRYADTQAKPQALVIVGGDGWNNAAILQRMTELRQDGYAICRPDHYVVDEDLPALYSGATALVHLALHEGFGLPPVQAQACGTPVIVSNLPVFTETLSPGGATFVPTNDPDAVAAALTNPPTPRQSVRVHYTWERAGAELMKYIAGADLLK